MNMIEIHNIICSPGFLARFLSRELILIFPHEEILGYLTHQLTSVWSH